MASDKQHEMEAVEVKMMVQYSINISMIVQKSRLHYPNTVHELLGLERCVQSADQRDLVHL